MTIPHQGIGRGRLVPSSHKGSKFRYTIVRQSIRGDVDKLVDKRDREMEDRRRRDQNVVFFNSKEHSNSQGVENRNADEIEVVVAQTKPQKSSPSELLWWLSVNK